MCKEAVRLSLLTRRFFQFFLVASLLALAGVMGADAQTLTSIGTGLNGPTGVAVDSSGNVYIADSGNNRLLKVTAGGNSQTTVATGLNGPTGVAVDTVLAATAYIADSGNDRVVKVMPAGPAGNGAQSVVSLNPPAPYAFHNPQSVAVDGNGNLYIANQMFVLKVPVSGGPQTWAPSSPMITLSGIAVDRAAQGAQYLYIADSSFNVVARNFLPNGGGSFIASGLNHPTGVAVDSAGNVYVADSGNNRVLKVPAGGGAQTLIATGLNSPKGVAVDNAGNVYIADYGNNRVLKVADGETAACQIPQPTSFFYQGAASPAVSNAFTPQIYPYSNTQPVPQFFGALPTPNSAPYALCPTKNSGCLLSSSATMLSTFSNLITATSLDQTLQAVGGYEDGKKLLCPLNEPNCNATTAQLVSYSDRCELAPLAPVLVARSTISFGGAQDVTANQQLYDDDQGEYVSVDSYLNSHVCGHQDRVILKLTESVNGETNTHFVYVTGRSPNGADWNVFDPGWKGAPSTLSAHKAGFTANGKFRTFKVAGVRTYHDISASGQPTGTASFTGNSPVELLVIDPAGRQLGNVNGTDIFQIPQGSYVRDYPLADDDGTGIANGDPAGIKTAIISSPLVGTYKVTVTGTALGTYTLRLRTLSTDGVVQNASVEGVTNTGVIDTHTVPISSTSGLSGPVLRLVTFDSTLADIDNSLQIGLIDNAGIANALSSKIQVAQAASLRGNNKTAINVLNAFQNSVFAQTGNHITGVAPQVLLEDVAFLVAQYK